MRQDTEDKRRAEIERIAAALLAEKGYGGISMLQVAKAVRASNQTLYRWYGNKEGLCVAILRRHAGPNLEQLDTALAAQTPLEQLLDAVGPPVLDMLLGDAIVVLGRAAAAEPGGPLARALAETGRDAIKGRLAQRLQAAGVGQPQAAADLYLTLLVGDAQLRRVIGTLEAPGPDKARARAARATRAFLRLLEPEGAPGG